jgi:hypothetical protein
MGLDELSRKLADNGRRSKEGIFTVNDDVPIYTIDIGLVTRSLSGFPQMPQELTGLYQHVITIERATKQSAALTG